MPSIISDFEYDIFISYRQNDNKRDGWVTEFVSILRDELEATVKDRLSIYYDENPYDGLRETHDVDDSLAKKLKCLIFIPIISQTFCDPNSFAWTNEFLAFIKLAQNDKYGFKILLPNGNTSTRVLPIQIHDLDNEDKQLLDKELGFFRSIDFVYKSAGVNRPLRLKDDEVATSSSRLYYRDQINKVANTIKEIIAGIKLSSVGGNENTPDRINPSAPKNLQLGKELKRRNLLRVSLVYILTALVLWKVADVSSALMGLSSNTQQLITLALIVLFPIALLFAWLFERSPEGFIRTGTQASKQNPFTDNQKKPLTSYSSILVLSILSVALFYFFPQSSNNKDSSTSTEKSIAVLPFINLSQDSEDEYFSDGITEDIIIQISKISDLKVISRSSVMRYKNTQKDIVQVGKELGVEVLLEGTVRLTENRARITANLSNASNRQQLWAETYDRKIEDLFDLQADVARDIVIALSANYSKQNSANGLSKPTESIEAYNLYLKAKFNYDKGEKEGFRLAASLSRQAIEIDANFAHAYAVLANAYSVIAYYQYHDIIDSRLAGKNAMEAAKRAIELNPQLPEAHDAMAYVLRTIHWKWSEAEKETQKAILLNPGFSSAHRRYSLLLAATGRFEEAIQEAMRALDLDPLGAFYNSDLARIHLYAGRINEAIGLAKKAFEMEPGYRPALGVLACAFEQQAMYDSAVLYVSRSKTRTGTDYEGIPEVFETIPKPHKEFWKEVLTRTQEDAKVKPISNMVMAILYIRNGDKESAINSLQKAFENREGSIVYVNVEPLFKPLHSDPRFSKIISSMGLSPN